ncbi:hypothetical protein [Polaribacter marinivivus]|uniref:hypothetical protein n=1 Tax=Polaribacter marinivivus TaxID=1524260 RepID=UPI003D8172ED
MYKSTIQQFILFVITTFIVIKTGKHMIELNDINSFFDFGMVMLFFIAFIIFLNTFLRLGSKLIGSLGF